MLDSAHIKGAVRKAAAAVIGFALAMVLLTALLLFGFYLLVQAAVLGLSPWLGEAGAMALSGFVCILLLALVFHHLTRPVSASKRQKGSEAQSGSGIDAIRNVIKENPLEAALMAFAVGIAEQKDPRLKSLLMEGGMVLMKQAESAKPDEPTAGEGPEKEDTPSSGSGSAL
ncbi:hypothetical protein SAMN04487881_0751 [Marinobacter sp. es.048]|uniref:hypothetical protein n=1 Tax=Marinobacter sp. es.048 TaxID=1761795 RepID=UPI000B705458|nr:hypothetical protein [Marinobacter sp. es.048]SNC62858.1 hypothetical protein SAMN04487881_0751 [Marinobacter sp. es.048]